MTPLYRAILVAPAESLGYVDGARPGPTIAAIDPLWLLLALSFPAVFVNLGHGHNGLLTAALFGAALVVLDRRPLLAGLLFGLLAYKPQFGVLIPLVLIATWRWRTVAAAVGTVSALAIVTTMQSEERGKLADHLDRALDARVVIEQAKGVLVQRDGVDPRRAFEELRAQARRSRPIGHRGPASPRDR